MDANLPDSLAEQQQRAKHNVVLAWCTPGQVLSALEAGHLGPAHTLIIYGNREVLNGLLDLVPAELELRQFPPGGSIARLRELRWQVGDLNGGRLIALHGSAGFPLKAAAFLWLLGLPGRECWTCDLFLNFERVTTLHFARHLVGQVLETMLNKMLMAVFQLRFWLVIRLGTTEKYKGYAEK